MERSRQTDGGQVGASPTKMKSRFSGFRSIAGFWRAEHFGASRRRKALRGKPGELTMPVRADTRVNGAVGQGRPGGQVYPVTDVRGENGVNIWGFVLSVVCASLSIPLSLSGTKSRRTVAGQKPGRYEVPSSTDLIQLISFAGGPVQYAKFSDVRITVDQCNAERSELGRQRSEDRSRKAELRIKGPLTSDL